MVTIRNFIWAFEVKNNYYQGINFFGILGFSLCIIYVECHGPWRSLNPTQNCAKIGAAMVIVSYDSEKNEWVKFYKRLVEAWTVLT